MIEGRDADARIMRGGDKCVTRSQTGADNSELVVALLFEPIETAAHIDDALAHGIESAADVGGDCIIGAADFGGHANIVIGHAQPQHRDAEQVQDFAQADVSDSVGVPVRQKHEGAVSPRRKPAGVHQIIFRIRRFYRRREAQKLGEGSLHFASSFGSGTSRVEKTCTSRFSSRKSVGVL